MPSKPAISENTNGYMVAWELEKLACKVSRLHQHKDGRLTAEITITTTNPDYGSMLFPPAQINFLAAATRKTLAKDLTARYPNQDWKWEELFDQLTYYIQDIARKGEPVSNHWTSEKIVPPEPLLYPLLYRGHPTIIYGEKSATKSTFALLIYIALTLPWVDNPLGWKLSRITKGVPTLILDWEVDQDTVNYNANRIKNGMDLPDFQVFYRRCVLPLAEDLEQIQNHIHDTKSEAVIIDSIGPAAGGDLNKTEPALAFIAGLRKLNVTSLLIGQTSKDPLKKTSSLYGNSLYQYLARSVFELRKRKEDEGDSTSIALFHHFCNLARPIRPMGYRLEYEGTKSIKVERESIESTAEFVERLGLATRILMELKGGKATTKELAENLAEDIRQVNARLTELKNKGKVVKVEDGWGLVAHE